jgi:hypothetical protein
MHQRQRGPQRGEPVSETLWKWLLWKVVAVKGGWLLSFWSSHDGMDVNRPCSVNSWFKQVTIQINAAATQGAIIVIIGAR